MSPILLAEFPTQLWAGDPEFALPGSGVSAPPGLEAWLSYNGLVMHDRQVVDKYRVLEISGLHSADIRDSREVLPGDDGEVPLESLLGGRTLVITVRVEAHNTGKLRDMEQALRTAFYSRIERPLRFNTGDLKRDVWINCRMVDKPGETERQDRPDSTFRDFQITLRASDPRYYSVSTLRYERLFSTASITEPIYTIGNGLARPRIQLHGPLSNVNITNERIMPDEIAMRKVIVEGSIPAGAYYVYDAYDGSLVDNTGVDKLGQLSVNSMDLRLAEGDNRLVISTDTFDANSKAEISYAHTWH